ncbi:MAG: class I SAM-dependent methyltransferase, partial [Thermomicrobiales bacterium]
MTATYTLEPTGERFLPWLLDHDYATAYEHIHRYLFAAQFVADKRVLDIACGEGFGTVMLARNATHVIGVDRDVATLAHARAHHAQGNIAYRHGDAQQLALEAESVDVVVSFETIEHFAAQEAFLTAIQAALTADGLLIISTPNPAVYEHAGGDANPFHARELDRQAFLSLLRQRFRHVCLYGQSTLAGSIIAHATGEYLLSDGHACQLAATAIEAARLDYPVDVRPAVRPRYFIALCSDGALPPVATQFMVDNNEALWKSFTLNRALLAERTREYTLLEEQQAQREQEQTRLAQEQGRLEEQQAQLEQQIREQAEQLAIAHQTVVEQATLLQVAGERSEFLISRERDLRDVFLSTHGQLLLRDEEIQRLRGDQDWHKGLIGEKERYITQLEQERTEYAQYATTLAAGIPPKDDYIAALERDREALKEYLATIEALVPLREEYIGTLEQAMPLKEAYIAQLEAAWQEQSDAIAASVALSASRETLIASQEARIARLAEECAERTGYIAALEAVIPPKEAYIAHLETHCAMQHEAIAAIAGDREEVRAYSARLETALAANEEHRRDLEARLHQRKRDRVHPRGRAAPRMP